MSAAQSSDKKHKDSGNCAECGQRVKRATRAHRGRRFCATCYARLFKPRPCSRCGETTRALSQEPEPLCRACAKADRVCARCGRPAPELGLIFEGRPVCPSCAPYFREAKPCSRCGKPSTKLSRIIGLTEEPVCDACRRHFLNATCSVCGKHRERFAITAEGKPLCKRCAAAPDATHQCPDCGATVGGPGQAPCMACQLARSLRRKSALLVGTIANIESRKVFAEFVEWLIKRKKTNVGLQGLVRYAGYFQRIDNAVRDGEALEARHVTAALSTDEIRRAGLLAMYLADRGLLVDSAEVRAERSELRRIASILVEADGRPWGKLVREFAAELEAAEGPLRPRTRRYYLRAAVGFLEHSRASDVRDIKGDHVRRYLNARPGQRASLCSWLTFLHAKTGLDLPRGRKKSRTGATVNKTAKTVAALIKATRGATSNRHRAALVAKLISVLFGVPLKLVLKMEVSNVECSAARVRINVNGQWLLVHEPVAQFLKTVFIEVGGERGRYLFAGRIKRDGLSISAVSYHLRPARSG